MRWSIANDVPAQGLCICDLARSLLVIGARAGALYLRRMRELL